MRCVMFACVTFTVLCVSIETVVPPVRSAKTRDNIANMYRVAHGICFLCRIVRRDMAMCV